MSEPVVAQTSPYGVEVEASRTAGGAPAEKATISRSATDHTVAPVSRRSNIRRKSREGLVLRVQKDRGRPAVRRISQQALTRPVGHIVLSAVSEIVGKVASAGFAFWRPPAACLKRTSVMPVRPCLFCRMRRSDPFQNGTGPRHHRYTVRSGIFDFRGQCDFDEDDGIWAVEVEFWSRYPSKRARPTGSRRSSWNISLYCPLLRANRGFSRYLPSRVSSRRAAQSWSTRTMWH